MLLCDFPFNGSDVKGISQDVRNKEPDFKFAEFKSVSKNCIDLIKQLLEKNKEKRISTFDALNHPWFVKENNDIRNFEIDTTSSKNALKCFSTYSKQSKL